MKKERMRQNKREDAVRERDDEGIINYATTKKKKRGGSAHRGRGEEAERR